MRLYDVANILIEKFSPLPKKDAMELQNEAALNYHKVLKGLEDKETFNAAEIQKKEENADYELHLKKLNLFEKVIKFSEQWWFKYILALVCIFLVKSVQNFILSDPGNDSDEGGEADEFAEFMRFKRLRGSL